MEINDSLVEYIAATYYNITPILGSIRKFYGYSDKNYSFTDSNDHKRYVLKLVNPDESQKELTDLIDETLQEIEQYIQEKQNDKLAFTVPRISRTSANRSSGYVTIKLNSEQGTQTKFVECNFRLWNYFDGIAVFDLLRQNDNSKSDQQRLYRKLGLICNQLFGSLSRLRHLSEQLIVVRKDFAWNLMNSTGLIEKNLENLFPEQGSAMCDDDAALVKKQRRSLITKTLNEFTSIRQELEKLPQHVLHSDLNTQNLLVLRESLRSHLHISQASTARAREQEHHPICIIDFQDIQIGPQVVEFSNTLLYLILEQEQIPFEVALKDITHWFWQGHQSAKSHRLELGQVHFVATLMKLRLSQSLLNGLLAHKQDPENLGVMYTNKRGWQLLQTLSEDGFRLELA